MPTYANGRTNRSTSGAHLLKGCLGLLTFAGSFRAALLAREALFQSFDLLANFLFAVCCRKEHVIRVFESLFPFPFHVVEMYRLFTLILLQRLSDFFVRLGTGAFQRNLEGFQFFSSKDAELLKLFEAEERDFKSPVQCVQRLIKTCF